MAIVKYSHIFYTASTLINMRQNPREITMTAFIIIDLTPADKEKLTSYSEGAKETLLPYQGKYLARGSIEILHGESKFQTKVVIQFPNRDNAVKWYNSPAYQDLIPIRNQGMRSQFHLLS